MSKLGNQVNELLIKYKNGNESAFRQLFDITYCSLIIVASKYIKDAEKAEDAVSEAYVTVYNKIGLFDENKDGYNWLCKIVENKVKDIIRAEKSYVSVELYDIPTTGELDKAETHIDVFRLLANLDEEEYKMVYLRYIEEKTIRQVAEELGLSVSKVERKLFKIVQKLKNTQQNII